jgi:hypothetical protein
MYTICSKHGVFHWKKVEAQKAGSTNNSPLCSTRVLQLWQSCHTLLRSSPSALRALYDNDVASRDSRGRLWRSIIFPRCEGAVLVLFCMQGELYHRLGSIIPSTVCCGDNTVVFLHECPVTYVQRSV